MKNHCQNHPQSANQYLKAINEPNRLKILLLLKRGELCVCEIFQLLNLPQNLASHHLKVLKDFDLLESRRRGLKIIYSRNEKAIKKCQNLLNNIINR